MTYDLVDVTKKKEQECDVQINPGHFDELRDRASLAIEFLDISLLQHPLVQQRYRFKDKVEEAIALIGKIYQEV